MELELSSFLSKAKPDVAAAIRSKCSHSEHDQLKLLLENLLSPSNDVDDEGIIDWLTWIIAGGSTPEEFSSTVRLYDKATTCGLVWTENFVAYRCRTCGISPCMSLCTECFQHGNHEGHDFIVFRSETGGACDCGEINIIKESGCCSLHGPRGSQNPGARTSRSDSNSSSHEQSAPIELLCIANEMMPYMFYRLLLSMREESRDKIQLPTMPKVPTCKHNNNNNAEASSNLSKGHKFIKMLQGLSDMGIAMRQVMINCLTNPPVYQNIVVNDSSVSDLGSKTFLEELVYWTVKFEFPEDLIRLLLSMRSDSFYKEAFTRAFVIHYRLVSETILKSADPEKLCKHVAAVSVQLFSIEQIAVEMVDKERLLHLLVASLYDMVNCTMVPSPELSKSSLVLDCDHEIMKNNYYWPIKSDLKELLSHQPVAMKFFQDKELLKNWFEFLSLFQGMNMSQFIEKGKPHIEQESETHIGAFTAELEISATPMWTLLSHLKDSSTATFTKQAVIHCWRKLQEWTELDKGEISFHLPLHRNLSMFIHQGIQYQGFSLKELLPTSKHVAPIVPQLVRLQANFYKILGRLWSRNGTEVLNQAESYVNSLCCNSMIDADLFLLQITSTYDSPTDFLGIVFEEFGVNEILNINMGESKSMDLDLDEQNTVIESCLLFLATLTSVRTNLGMSDERVMALEMTTLLCKGDKLHSELMELLPERCGSDSQLKNFENILTRVADYQAPRNMQQGKYVPKPEVWKAFYDPIHTLLRSSNRSDFQASLDRFEEYCKHSNIYSGSQSPWPPFRIPSTETGPFPNPGLILSSGALFEVLFIILYRAVHLKNIPNFIIALTLYLFELALNAYPGPSNPSTNEPNKASSLYKTNNLVDNFKARIDVSSWSENSVKTESIISLLIKLHSQLQGNSKSYKPPSPQSPVKVGESNSPMEETHENRIGDGAFFTAKLLDKIIQSHPSIFQLVLKEINQTDQTSELVYEKEREEKRRKAKERKLQLMTEFAMKRQQFMKEVQDDMSEIEEEEGTRSIVPESLDSEYECVICKERGASKPQNPFGLITFIIPSGILAHRKAKDSSLPDPPKNYQHQCTSTGQEFEKYFDNNSIKLTVPVDGGVGVCTQTCGHYIHTDCFTSYINSLRKSRSYILQNHSIQLNYKRFYCPLCRQIGNSFLPLIQDSLASVSGSTEDEVVDISELTRLLRKRNTLVLSPKQKQGVERFLDDLHKTVTLARYQLSPAVPSETAQTVSSMFLHSLDMELERTKNKSLGDIKRSCLSPLYSILRYSYKSLSAGHSRKISQMWEIICGTRSAKGQKEVPILLGDLDLALAHLVLQLPYGAEGKFLDVIVERLWHLKLVQILLGLCLQLDPEELMEVKAKQAGNNEPVSEIQSVLISIIQCLETSKRLTDRRGERTVQSSSASSQILSSMDLESFVRSRMVPFLRRAELLRQFVLKGKAVSSSTSAIPMDVDECSSGGVDFLRSISSLNKETIIPLLLGSIVDSDLISEWNVTSALFTPHLLLWDEPKFIDIPLEYDRIFQTYRKIECQNCNSMPSEPALCLACGTIVCLNSFCCIDKQSKLSEIIHHSIECGMGTSVFLCVLSSAILVVVGNDACVWGSIFLDSFGEEDLDLKRGKPLFLCKERFLFLQRQWITHSFLKSELKWFPHDNML